MSNCCSTTGENTRTPRKYTCPINGREYGAVHLKTMFHHVREPWSMPVKKQGYYFCSDPECEVVYFGQDGAIFLKSELRTKVGIKEAGEDRLICYCFGITRLEAEHDATLKQFVLKKTRELLCSCESSNPSGHCCLGEFTAR